MGFVKKFGGYASGNLLTLLAGLLSFPVFTRMLSPSDYGVMSLINLTSSLCITFCKGGLQHAVIREWEPDIAHNRMIVSTALFGVLILTCGIFVVLFSIAIPILIHWDTTNYLLFILITCAIIFTEVVKSVFYSKLRAMQETLRYNIVTVFSKYGQVLLAILFMLLFSRTVVNLFLGFIVISISVIIWLCYTEREYLSTSAFDYSKFKAMLAFGFPLIFYELNNQLLTFADRYVIGIYKGAAAVGAYSAAYNMTFYIQNLLVSSVSLTIYPMIVEKMKQDGDDAYRKFMRESLLWFCLFSSAVVLGFAALGKDIFLLAATTKYAEATVVITPVICGGFFYGLFIVTAGELFVLKSTKTMAVIMATAALINLCLDLIFIPKMGLLGAAYATLIPELLLAGVGLLKMGAMKDIGLLWSMIYNCMPSIVMYLVLDLFGGKTSWISVITRFFIGILLWASTILLTNKTVRHWLMPKLIYANKR